MNKRLPPSRIDTFTYKRAFQLISLITPISVVLIIGYLLVNPPLETPISSERYLLIVLMATPFTLLFAIGLHLMYPTVHVSRDGLQIKTLLYESRWLPWSAIREVRIPQTRLVTQICIVWVDGISPLYYIVALSQSAFGRAFLIHPRISNGEKLIRLLIKHRPDLFPPPRSTDS